MANQIDTLLDETRRFPPTEQFAAQANATEATYQAAAKDREAFWATEAAQLDWIEPWHTVLEWTLPHAKWFLGGKLNVSSNCLDRHVAGGRADKAHGEPPSSPTTRRMKARANSPLLLA